MDDALPPRSALLQAVFLIECVADRKLDAERFLPPQPIVVTVDTRLAERADFRKFLGKLVPPMLEKAETIASERAKTHVDEAVAQATETLDAELSRLLALRAVNPAISATEIAGVADERTALLKTLPEARLRLDAVRFVVSPDFLALR